MHILMGKSDRKLSLGRLRYKPMDNFKIVSGERDFSDFECGGV